MFFTHNTQYSLLFLIHVQIQCDLTIISFTCVNVCSLNCLNLVNVCFGDPCTQILLNWETILRDYCVDWIIGWIVCWIAFMSVFFSSRKTVLKSWLDTSSTPPRYLAICRASQAFFLSQSRQLLDTWWIDRECSCLLDSFSTPGGSIELLFLDLIPCCSTLARYLSCRIPFSRYLPW